MYGARFQTESALLSDAFTLYLFYSDVTHSGGTKIIHPCLPAVKQKIDPGK